MNAIDSLSNDGIEESTQQENDQWKATHKACAISSCFDFQTLNNRPKPIKSIRSPDIKNNKQTKHTRPYAVLLPFYGPIRVSPMIIYLIRNGIFVRTSTVKTVE